MTAITGSMRQTLLTALADKDMVRIMNLAKYKLISVSEIIRQTELPHTTAYRKVKWLVDSNLLVVDRIIITPDGKRSSMFRTSIRNVVVKYVNDEISVEAEMNHNQLERTAERLFSLD